MTHEVAVLAPLVGVPAFESAYWCEECHTTEGETVYNKSVSTKRLCRPCYEILTGTHDYAIFSGRTHVEMSEAKDELVVNKSCDSCGLPGDISRPLPHIDGSENLSPEDFALLVKNGWIEGATPCKYILNPEYLEEVKTFEKASVLPRNTNNQIKLPGVNAVFCSTMCLMQGLFTDGRCCGCAKVLPHKKTLREWHRTYEGKGVHEYPPFESCGDKACNKYLKERRLVFTSEHLSVVLDTLLNPQVKIRATKPCAAGTRCLKYEDRRPAPAVGRSPYCSRNCLASDKIRLAKASAGSSEAIQ
jgi:hypothetical protein